MTHRTPTQQTTAPAVSRDSSDGIASLSLPPDIDRGDADTLSEVVYQTIRDAICYGRLDSHFRLAQNPLAAQFGISRTPVRDALLRLAQEGLVRSVAWRGYVVNAFEPHDILNIYDVRIPLELRGVERALGHHSPLQLSELRAVHLAIGEGPCGTVAEFYELNRRFHALLVEPCGNPVLLRMLDQLWHLPVSQRMFSVYVAEADSVAEMEAEHGEILDALEAGDRERLLALLRAHLAAGGEDTLARFERAPAHRADGKD